jgi:hypothetical protein
MTRGHFHDSLAGPLFAWGLAVTVIASALALSLVYLLAAGAGYLGF